MYLARDERETDQERERERQRETLGYSYFVYCARAIIFNGYVTACRHFLRRIMEFALKCCSHIVRWNILTFSLVDASY